RPAGFSGETAAKPAFDAGGAPPRLAARHGGDSTHGHAVSLRGAGTRAGAGRMPAHAGAGEAVSRRRRPGDSRHRGPRRARLGGRRQALDPRNPPRRCRTPVPADGAAGQGFRPRSPRRQRTARHPAPERLPAPFPPARHRAAARPGAAVRGRHHPALRRQRRGGGAAVSRAGAHGTPAREPAGRRRDLHLPPAGTAVMDPFFRALIIYLFLLTIFRVFGNRSLAQTTTFDLLLLLVVGETTQQALLGQDYSVTNALVIISVLVGLDMGLAKLKDRFPK